MKTPPHFQIFQKCSYLYHPLKVTVFLFTYQYGVPMKESLLCRVLLFFADTPKSATGNKAKTKLRYVCELSNM